MSLLYALAYVAASGDETHRGSFVRLITTGGGAQESRFVGGSQVVSERIADRLGRRVVLGAPVRRIVQDGDGVRVVAAGLTVRAKRAIVTVPPVLALDIAFTPVLPAREGADPARPAPGPPDEGRGGLPAALLARRGPDRSERDRPRGRLLVRQQPARREHRRPHGVHRRRPGPPPPGAERGGAAGGGARHVRGDLRRRGPHADRLRREGLDPATAGRRAARPRTRRPASCAATARRSAAPPAACTGPAARPRRSGRATWTAPCAPANGPRTRSRRRCDGRSPVQDLPAGREKPDFGHHGRSDHGRLADEDAGAHRAPFATRSRGDARGPRTGRRARRRGRVARRGPRRRSRTGRRRDAPARRPRLRGRRRQGRPRPLPHRGRRRR